LFDFDCICANEYGEVLVSDCMKAHWKTLITCFSSFALAACL
jgi:hypothetical protein